MYFVVFCVFDALDDEAKVGIKTLQIGKFGGFKLWTMIYYQNVFCW